MSGVLTRERFRARVAQLLVELEATDVGQAVAALLAYGRHNENKERSL